MGTAGLNGRRLIGLLVAFVLVLASCGGSSSDSDSGDSASGSGTDEDRVGGQESAGEPQPGGDLVIAVEAETDGWDPTDNNWAVSGHFVASAVYDQLAMFDEDGNAQPYLAASFTPNEDFTSWDIGLREGVTFHDGTPLDAEGVVANLDAYKASGLVGPIYSYVDTFEAADPMTVRVTMSEPWATFPVSLTTQAGYIVLPAALEAETANLEPVGTGPFVFDEWVPDSAFKASKNENYWQEGKPYVDSVEFRPIIDNDARIASLQTGELNAIHTSDQEAIIKLRDLADSGDVQVVEDGAIGEESFAMLNLDEPPFDDVRVRQALAHAVDPEQYVEVVDLGVREPAYSPFVEGLPWYSQEAVDAYPEYDPAQAQALVDEYEAEVGPIEFTYQDTPGNEEEQAFLQQAWEAVGMDVEVTVVEQGQHIVDALTGEYQAVGWRLFGNPDPDGEFVWWSADNANPIGEIALNFARLDSPDLQAALVAGRQTTDFDERKAAYDEAQTIINEELPYIWQNHTLWVFAGENTVQNLAFYKLPDGANGLGVYAGFPGATKLTDVWLEQGG